MRFLQVNPALCAMLGYDEPSLLALGPDDLTAPSRGGLAVLARPAEPDEREREMRYLHADGHEVWVHVRASRVRGGDGEALFDVTQLRDVTEQRRSEAQLRHFADHDPLTGVLNRRRFEQEVDRALSLTRRHLQPAAVMVVDLDQFKYINDTYGHAHGDALLRRVTRVLRSRLRSTDLLGRLGGDEFGVVCPQTTMAGARHLADDLLLGVRRDGWIQVGDRQVRMTMSIGVAVIDPATGLDREQLLAAADSAMYDAKESGRDRVMLVGTTRPQGSRMRERLAWSERIRDALESDGLVLWEQPLLDLRTGRRDRSELLVRISDPDGGPPALPERFLPVAERFGQIAAIDRWVLARAVDLLAARRPRGCSLSVNLSATSLVDGSVVEFLAERLCAAQVDPSGLTVEVTETAAISDLEVVRPVLSQLRSLGCSLALDDFGSGFASLGYLKHLPFDCVKIDGDFVRDLPRSGVDQATVQAIVTMCAARGITTVAEWVQDEQTLDLLRALGVDRAQGNHISAPHPLPEDG